jgi:hypothetical protein
LADATLARACRCRGGLLFLSLNEIASAAPDYQQAISQGAAFAAAHSHLGIALARPRRCSREQLRRSSRNDTLRG